MPKNLGDDAIASSSPSSSTSSVSDSYSGSRSDSDSDYGGGTLLIPCAKESLERQAARCRARENILETERTAMPSETIHPRVSQSLHIVDQYNRGELAALAWAPSRLTTTASRSLVHRRQIFQEDLEEGEIRF